MTLITKNDYINYYKSFGFDVFINPKWNIQCIAINYKNKDKGQSFRKAFEDSEKYIPIGVKTIPISHNIIMWYIKKFLYRQWLIN